MELAGSSWAVIGLKEVGPRGPNIFSGNLSPERTVIVAQYHRPSQLLLLTDSKDSLAYFYLIESVVF